jgi:hypothetical protein
MSKLIGDTYELHLGGAKQFVILTTFSESEGFKPM